MKAILFGISLLFISLTSCSYGEKTITVEQLPLTAQEFIKKFYNTQIVAITTMDDNIFNKDYEVVFISGDKIEFNSKGEWDKVKSNSGNIPLTILQNNVSAYIQSTYPGQNVIEIDKNNGGMELKLDNGIELDFNDAGNITKTSA